MPINRNALIRFKTIDACLQRRNRRWTLDDLIEACSDALYEYEGIRKGVSMRTVQMDIQMMRSEKLGYNAPIIVLEKKYYTYEDPTYTITKIPMTGQDLGTLNEVIDILKQFKGFSHFQEVSSIVNRLQDKIITSKNEQQPIIDFEKNDHLIGLEWLDVLYGNISKKEVITVEYQSFKARQATTFNFHPHLLKEYRNRWFVLGLREKGVEPQILALDRIKSIEKNNSEAFRFMPDLTADYFKNMVGVTRGWRVRPVKIQFWMNQQEAPYMITKPIHPSQEIIENTEGGVIFEIKVIINPELERVFLGYGHLIKILGPDKLKYRIRDIHKMAFEQYNETNSL